jgi:small subunit ribosomal protein S8
VEEGYMESFDVVEGNKPHQTTLRLRLRYIGERRNRRPLITGLERVSRPGCRVYSKKSDIPWVLSGIGVAILSTPKGVMTGQRARKMGVGGEILCKVW